MPRLDLDLKDRLILSNQYKILEALHQDDADGYASLRKVVEEGYTLHYDDLTHHIYDGLSVEECREVLDILEMFDQLHYAYEQLDDKGGIDPHRVKFHGFDGNNETAYLGYARYFLVDLRRYEALRNAGDDLNSHAPLLDEYRRMVEVHKAIPRRPLLSKTEIQRITEAGVHPDNR